MDDQLDAMELEDLREIIREDTPSGPSYPPQFARPGGLSEDGQLAWQAIMRVLIEQRVVDTGLNRQVFLSPRDWLKESAEAELVVAHDGGDHAPYFNLDYGACLNRAVMTEALRWAGYHIETINPMYSAICLNPPGETEVAFMERLVMEDLEDDDEANLSKELSEPGYVEQIQSILRQAGLHLLNYSLVGCSSFMRFETEVSGWYPWATALETNDDELDALARWVRDQITGETRRHTVWHAFFDQDTGLWKIVFLVNADVFERLEDDDEANLSKELSEPATKLEHIRMLFATMGLHISSTLEIPSNSLWGDLGKPHRQILAYLQPDANKPFSSIPISTPEFVDFLRRVKSSLGEILETTEIDYTTTFRRDLNCWEITWFIDDPTITQDAEFAESLEDDEEDNLLKDAEYDPSQFQPGDIVREPGSHWPGLTGRISHSSGWVYEEPETIMWWVEWGKHPSLDGPIPANRLELVRRPRQVEETKEEEDLAEGIVGYHASPNRFKKFDTSREGSHFGTVEQAANLRKPGLRKPKAYDLDLKNPLRLPDLGIWNDFNGLHAYLANHDHITRAQADRAWEGWQRSDKEGWASLKQALAENGYDSIVYQNEQEGSGDSYIALRSEQIKPVKESKSIDQIMDYQRSIADKLEAAKQKAIAEEQDPKEKTALEHGHGTYLGNCGHPIRQCRCSHVTKPIQLDVPCAECAQPVEECVQQELPEALDNDKTYLIISKQEAVQCDESKLLKFRGSELRMVGK